MKYLSLMLVSLLLAACQTAPQDTLAVEDIIRTYFDGISHNDKAGAQAVCTEDYTLVENGKFWNNDSLFAFAAPLFEQGATITYRFDNFHTTIHGNSAWTYYENYGLMTMGGEDTPLHWTESAFFRYEGRQWKMTLLHSTPIREE